MKLPEGARAVVDMRKLRDYCLDPAHPRGRHKARVFAAYGIRAADAALLQGALLEAARNGESSLGTRDAYGQRYAVDFDLIRPGRTVKIRSIWIVLTGESTPRLTTCFVL